MIRIPAAGKQNLIPVADPVRLSNGFAEVSQTSPLFLRSNNIHNIQREASNDFQQFSNARSAFNAQHPTIPMDQPNSIKNWAEDDRPREKLLHKGPAALADAELLAILINTGTTKYSALDLAREVLKKADGRLSDLGRLSLKELQQVHGIGEAKAITIAPHWSWAAAAKAPTY